MSLRRRACHQAGFVTSGGFNDPYLHLTPEQYGALAERNGLHVCRSHTEAKAWDFKTRSAFLAFGSVTFVEWTQFLPAGEKGSPSSTMSWIATGLWRPIDQARRILSSFIKWMSRFRLLKQSRY